MAQQTLLRVPAESTVPAPEGSLPEMRHAFRRHLVEGTHQYLEILEEKRDLSLCAHAITSQHIMLNLSGIASALARRH
jgi:hypothetical protein